ncbi:MAG: hypothetical protein JWQ04_2069, partial [Pedosphaera sp.]|nr:hypothetical protein [Pedosphaera sp.]
MKTNMKTGRLILGVAVVGCAMAAWPMAARGQVSEADFQSLKEAVLKLSEKVQKLEQTHETDQQTHQKDVEQLQQLQQLQQRLGETQKTVADVQQKAVSVVPVEGIPRTPLDEATVNHNFSILGDAEVQYQKASGQHGTFLFADFAPICLYRGGEKVLF